MELPAVDRYGARKSAERGKGGRDVIDKSEGQWKESDKDRRRAEVFSGSSVPGLCFNTVCMESIQTPLNVSLCFIAAIC